MAQDSPTRRLESEIGRVTYFLTFTTHFCTEDIYTSETLTGIIFKPEGSEMEDSRAPIEEVILASQPYLLKELGRMIHGPNSRRLHWIT